MLWMKIIQWIIRIVAGGGVLFALQHEARAAELAGGVGISNFLNFMTWVGAAVAAWAATSGPLWQRLVKFLEWFKNNPAPPVFARLDKAQEGLNAAIECCACCNAQEITDAESVINDYQMLLTRLRLHAHKHATPPVQDWPR